MPATDFIDLASKTERAFRWLLICNGAGTVADVYTTGYSSNRTLPNRTVVAESLTPVKSIRTEAMVMIQVQHRFAGTLQPGESEPTRLIERDQAVALTLGALTKQTDGQSLNINADQVTAAGRDLAIPNPSLTDPAAIAADAKIATDNADMANFRCDEVLMGNPFLERGHPEKDATIWMININLMCRVSNSSGNSD